MAKKPNYDFERRERERLKKEKKVERAGAKLAPATDEDRRGDADQPPKEEE